MKTIAGVIMIYSILCTLILAGKKDIGNELLYIMITLLMAIYIAR